MSQSRKIVAPKVPKYVPPPPEVSLAFLLMSIQTGFKADAEFKRKHDIETFHWDDLDNVLNLLIKNDAHAKRVVNVLMSDRALDDIDADAAEEVAARIIGNRQLRYT